MHSEKTFCMLLLFVAAGGFPNSHTTTSPSGGTVTNHSMTEEEHVAETRQAKPGSVRHIVVHVELPETTDMEPWASKKWLRQIGPNKLCRMLKRRFERKSGSNIHCTGTKWNSLLTEEDSALTADPKMLRYHIRRNLPSVTSSPVPELTTVGEIVTVSPNQLHSEVSNHPFSKTLVVLQTILVKKELPETWSNIFPGKQPTFYERPVENLLELIKQPIQSMWSLLCTSNIIWSGKLLSHTNDSAEFSVRLYFPTQTDAEYCPDINEQTTLDSLVQTLNEWFVVRTTNSTANDLFHLKPSKNTDLHVLLLRIELIMPNWTFVPQSEPYRFAKNEVIHQLEQIILLQMLDSVVKHFEFYGFLRGKNGSVAALFKIYIQSSRINFENLDRDLKEGLAAIKSTDVSVQKGLDYQIGTLMLDVKRGNTSKEKYEELLDNESVSHKWLDYQLRLFVFSGLRRCDLFDSTESFELTITPISYSPEVTDLNVTLKLSVNRTILLLQRNAHMNAFFQCAINGLTSEKKNWIIHSISLQPEPGHHKHQ